MNTRRSWAVGFLAGVLSTVGVAIAVKAPFAADPTRPYSKADVPVPIELATLNNLGRDLYTASRNRELATIPAVVFVSGNDLVLRRGAERTVAPVIPPEYHSLKCVAHITLTLCVHLIHEPGRPLALERLDKLREYRSKLEAAGPAVERCGFDPETLNRQHRMIARGLALCDRVLRDAKISEADLLHYCRESRSDAMLNSSAAAVAQVNATHRQMMEWKKQMTEREWAELTAIIPGRQTPRAENIMTQYFARLFGEKGEGRRVVYAESLWEEADSLNLLGTLRLDGRLSEAVFGDPYRMYRDLLADVGRVAIDQVIAKP